MTQDPKPLPNQPAADPGICPVELQTLLQADLSSGAVHLYCALRLAAQETGWCTRKQLMDATAVSVNKARAALDQLQQIGRAPAMHSKWVRFAEEGGRLSYQSHRLFHLNNYL